MPREFSIPPDARARSKMLFGETTSESEQEEAKPSVPATSTSTSVEVPTADSEDLSQREEEVTQS